MHDMSILAEKDPSVITSSDVTSWLATVKYEDDDPNWAPSSLCPVTAARPAETNSETSNILSTFCL